MLGSPAQKRRYLPALLAADQLSTTAITEPGVGSDAAAIAMTARRVGDRYVLDGAKAWLTIGTLAEVATVLVATDPARGGRGLSRLIVDMDHARLPSSTYTTLGDRLIQFAEVTFAGYAVPVENRACSSGAQRWAWTRSAERATEAAMPRLSRACRGPALPLSRIYAKTEDSALAVPLLFERRALPRGGTMNARAIIIGAAIAIAATLAIGSTIGVAASKATGATKPGAARPVKEFTLSIAEHEHELYPGGPKIHAWAFNGDVPGPVMRVTEGDLVRVHFTNNHTSNHTLHFHGMNLTNEHDGVAYGALGHLEVKPGETRTYEFVADPAGTHMYHCHVNSPQHIDMGMVGALIVEPKDKRAEPKVDFEKVVMLDDWYLNESGGHEAMAHPAMIHQANYFTVNGKAFPGIEPIKMEVGQKARVRLINVGYQAHSMHLHGHSFVVTHRDGRRVKTPQEQDTVMIGPGERYDLVFTATNPGLWLFHCHVVPHVTNDGAYPGGLLIPVVTTAKAGTPAKKGAPAAPAAAMPHAKH